MARILKDLKTGHDRPSLCVLEESKQGESQRTVPAKVGLETKLGMEISTAVKDKQEDRGVSRQKVEMWEGVFVQERDVRPAGVGNHRVGGVGCRQTRVLQLLT